MTADTKETILCFVQSFFLALGVVGLLIALMLASWEGGYKRGWCESREGVYLSDWKCDIDGRVVGIERKD